MLTGVPNRVSALFAHPLHSVLRELNRDLPRASKQQTTHLPALSLWEDAGAIHVEVDVPGVALADLDVSMEKDKLTIRGERKPGERSADFVYDERSFGQFERTVTLQEGVDPAAIEAVLRDGVLHLKLTKKPQALRQKVTIQYADGTNSAVAPVGAPDASGTGQDGGGS